MPRHRLAMATRVAALCALTVTSAVLLVLGGCTPRIESFPVPAGRMGDARLFAPRTPASSLVLLFSDDSGWNAGLDAAAMKLAGRGAIVVGVDLPTFLHHLATTDDVCHDVVSEIEELSHRVEREHGFRRYRWPVLAGIGAGATFAYAALAESPVATVAGAVGVDPSAALVTRVPICAGAPATPVASGGFAYGPRAELPGWWRVSVKQGAPAASAELAAPAVVETAAAGTSATDRLVTLVSAALGTDDDDSREDAPDGMSVVAYPSAGGATAMAIIYSGDGGWRDLDKQIGETLAERGLPVVGVDSLRSFWTARTSEEMARDLAQLMQTYQDRWGTDQVVLIGYSFGAGVLPFVVNQLTPAERARIVLIALLGLEARADFEIHFTGWFGQEPDENAPEVLPQLLKLDLRRVQCFYGEDEEDSLCRSPALAAAGADVIGTSGGHHFDGDYDALAERILAGVEQRSPGSVPPSPAPSAPSSR